MPGDDLTHGPPATKKQAAVSTGLAGSTGIPCAMVYGLYRDLLGDRAFLPPSPARSSCELDLSIGRPGPRDFTVRDKAHSSDVPSASIASRLTCRDDRANVPLHRGGMGEKIVLICPTPQARLPATDWHVGQFAHGVYAGAAPQTESPIHLIQEAIAVFRGAIAFLFHSNWSKPDWEFR